ncbi:hypothetical protein [Salarchaeum japonicum]|uniref:hypothetical protein n=1 Tax=Salarchaeum japonicum TaxID=555573 RepID=UPI003C731222
MDHGTVLALATSTAVALLATLLVMEGLLAGLQRVATLSSRDRVAFRIVGYGVPAVLNTVVTVHNVRRLLQAP